MRELSAFIDCQDSKHQQIISYWISDYVKFLQQENEFDPRQFIRYKRGAIVKAHLGYRIGSEEGGLHYAIVVDTNNALSSPTVTIVPLTSVKEHTNLEKLHISKIYLGNEVYQKLNAKAENMVSRVSEKIRALGETSNTVSLDLMAAQTAELQKELSNLRRVQKELSKMKTGSIALVGQIVTISKIRIYDPLYPTDTLANIRLSAESLDKIDNKIIELFTHRS